MEDGARLLLVKPLEEFLKTWISLDLLNCVVGVSQFVVRPSLMDKVFAGPAGGRGDLASFATRHNMVPTSEHLALAKDTNVQIHN